MCNRATHSYPSTIPFVPEYYKTQEICDNTVNTLFCFFLGGGGGGRGGILVLFPIGIRFKKCVTELFPRILLC